MDENRVALWDDRYGEVPAGCPYVDGELHDDIVSDDVAPPIRGTDKDMSSNGVDTFTEFDILDEKG